MAQDLRRLSDPELMHSLKGLAREERGRVVEVLRHLIEMERRRLALKEGYPSLFEYCRRELRYAEGEAVRRIQAARAAARYPVLLRAVARGALSLTTASMLAPHLRWDNFRRLIRGALGKSKREVERLLAAECPAAEPPERVRFVAARPSPPAGGPPPASDYAPPRGAEAPPRGAEAPPRGGDSRSTAPEAESAAPPQPAAPRVHFSFTAGEALLADVERAKGLLRHRFPFGGLEEVFTEAVEALLEKLDPAGKPPRPLSPSGLPRVRSRRIPSAVKSAVWRRDGGRCAFVSPGGRRCARTDGLEFDHVRPFALGGASDDPANLRLLCRAHNDLQARLTFGDEAVDAARGAAERRDPGLAPGVG